MALKLYLALVRVNYALVVAVSATFGGYCALLALTASLGDFFAWTSSAIMAFILCWLVSRAIVRKWRRGKLVDRPAGHGEWAIVFFMTVAGAFAHLLVFIVCHAFYQYRHVYPEKDIEGGPMAFFLMIATGFYVLALLLGEYGLEHQESRAQPRISPASGLTDALPGNTADSSAADDTPR